jgi:hypothetical protein
MRCGVTITGCDHRGVIICCMEDEHYDSFEEMLRSVAREVSRSAEQFAEQLSNLDLDELAGRLGVDAGGARHWFEGAATWLRSQAEEFEHGFDPRPPRRGPEPRPGSKPRPEPGPGPAPRPRPPASDDPLRAAAPHPLDLPTDEQGLALAALESGRWTVEPGTEALAVHGDGPGPSDALGLVRELRVRDWIATDGTLTLAGRQALRRWLEASARR